MSKKIAVVLCGCGRMDGSEVHESVLTLLAIDEAGASYQCFAPNDNQHEVVDHFTNKKVDEVRNMMVEAARIARGDIKSIEELNVADFDAIIFPGGSGSAKNLFTFALDGVDCSVRDDVERVIVDGLKALKPMGFICITPVLLAKVSGKHGYNVNLTIGTDEDTAQAVEEMGVRHVQCLATEVAVDHPHKLVTTPAYMLGQRISDVAQGIKKCVGAVLDLM